MMIRPQTMTMSTATGKQLNVLTRQRYVLRLLVLCMILIVSLVIGLCYGSESISLVAIAHLARDFFTGHDTSVSETERMILFGVRLPRVLLGAITGAALSVAGALLQVLLRNPLAEPYVLGVSSGAAAGALVSLIVFPSIALGQPVAAFIGAMLTTAVIYGMSRNQTGVSTEKLVLAGVIMASFLWSGIALLLAVVHDPSLRGISFWLHGDLSGGQGMLGVIATGIMMAIVLASLQSRQLNLLMVGEEDAFVLGVPVERVKTIAYLLSSFLTGLGVAVSGSIGFVGLIVPHLVRLVWGSDNRVVIPASAFVGGSILVLADVVARTIIAPRELPVGAVTALVGAPIFVYLLKRR